MIIPVEVDFGAPFASSQQEAWDAEYKSNVGAMPWTWGLDAHDELGRDFGTPSALSKVSMPQDWLEELEAMEPAERRAVLDELAVRPDLWDEEEVAYEF